MFLLSFPIPHLSLPHLIPHTQGTDEATIISVLTKRSNGHRQEVRKKFQALYNKVCVCVCAYM